MATDFVLFLKTITHPDHARAITLATSPIFFIVFDRPVTVEQLNWVQNAIERDPLLKTLVPQEQKVLVNNIRDALIRQRATLHT